MKLAWATDIHLNFLNDHQIEEFCGLVDKTGAHALVITGDISEAPHLASHLKQLDAHVQIPIYYVMGNHDAYRGSIAEVKSVAREMTSRLRRVKWLPATGVVTLAPGVALVGCDGWSDGRLGDWAGSTVFLNDYLIIDELRTALSDDRLLRLQAVAKVEAELALSLLRRAMVEHDSVLFATHVPPFRDACWYNGKISNDDWLPHFCSKVMGDTLLEVMSAYPTKYLRVLCGHTHGAGVCQPAANLRVDTGGAEYGQPRINAVIDTDNLRSSILS